MVGLVQSLTTLNAKQLTCGRSSLPSGLSGKLLPWSLASSRLAGRLLRSCHFLGLESLVLTIKTNVTICKYER